MKRWLILILFLALCGPALAEIKIVGPTEPIAAGEYTQLTVSGVTAAALPTAKLVLWPREKTQLIAAQTWTGEPLILFQSKQAGKYLIALSIPKDGKIDYGEIVVTVGGEVPLPPSPDPPGPQPGAKFQLLFLFQSDKLDNLPAGQREILASLKFRKELEAKGHLVRGFFGVDSGKDAPEDLAPFFAAAEGKELPRVAVSPHAGGKIETFSLPADPAGLWKLLKDPKAAAIDRDFLEENHWRLTPGTCGMLGCFKHGSQWILEKGGAQ